MVQYRFSQLTHRIIRCVIEVHKNLGPGLLESAYEASLMHELKNEGLKVQNQIPVPVIYKDIKLNCGYRIDVMVEDTVIIELKATESLNEVHEAQVLTHMKFSQKPVGLLINFNCKNLRSNIRRFVL